MATPNRLTEIAAKRGQTVEQMIDQELSESGSVAGAARGIGVTTWTVARWILLNDFDVAVEQKARLVKTQRPKAELQLS